MSGYKSGKNKIAIDDLVASKGRGVADDVLKKWVHPVCLGLDKIKGIIEFTGTSVQSLEAREQEYARLMHPLSECADAQLSMLGREVKKVFNISLKQLLNDVKRYRKQSRPSKNSRDVINLGDPKSAVDSIKKIIMQELDLYKYGNEIVCITNNKQATLDVKALQCRLLQFVDFQKKGEKILLPSEFSAATLADPDLETDLPEIKSFTEVPAYGDNWTPIKSGFDPKAGVYYVGEVYAPKMNLKILPKLLEGFCFKTEASRDNTIAILLAMLFRFRFPGSTPAAIITANRHQTGKTALARTIALIRQGYDSGMVEFCKSNEELSKRIATRIRKPQCLTLPIDNIRSNAVIESTTLEMMITSPKIALRLLGQNTDIERDNHFMVILTMNKGHFSADLISRSIPIELHLDESIDADSREFAIGDINQFVMNHRHEIICELFGMVEKWKALGFPLCNKPFRFQQYAREIGGILEANGFNKFLDNLSDARASYDENREWIAALFHRFIGKNMTAKDLLGSIPQGLAYLCDKPNPSIALGLLLKNYVGKEITLPDGNVFVLGAHKDTHTKVTYYRASLKHTLISLDPMGSAESSNEIRPVILDSIQIGAAGLLTDSNAIGGKEHQAGNNAFTWGGGDNVHCAQ